MSRLGTISTAQFVLAIALISLTGCGTASPYFRPHADTGTVGYPPSTACSYGLCSKDTIYFSPPGDRTIRVFITLRSDPKGRPTDMEIAAFKSYFDDPYYKAMPYEQAKAEVAKDRRQVIADSGFVELHWSDGTKQSIPLAFPGQRGLTFVISGEPVGGLAIAASMVVSLDNNSEGLDVTIPNMTISGHRLEIPLIHFQRASR